MKRKLLVFAGKPGIGKSTLISDIKKDWVVVDVWPFLVPYIEPGYEVPPEEKNILGYRDMYEHIAQLRAGDVILEIGTNYPDFNVSELTKLAEQYDILILLCDAPIDVIRERGKARGYRYNDSFELRLQRDFPNAYVKLLKETRLDHIIFNMQGEREEVLGRLRQIITE